MERYWLIRSAKGKKVIGVELNNCYAYLISLLVTGLKAASDYECVIVDMSVIASTEGKIDYPVAYKNC